METITKIISPQQDGATVRHILKAELHFSTHAVARLTVQCSADLFQADSPCM